MATLLLTKTWLNLYSTGAAVSGFRDGDDADTAGIDGGVRTYAGGRQRSYTTQGVTGTWSFRLRQVSYANTEVLRSWLGMTVQVRDNRGRCLYGVLLDVPRVPWKEQLDTYDVEISLRLVTADPGV